MIAMNIRVRGVLLAERMAGAGGGSKRSSALPASFVAFAILVCGGCASTEHRLAPTPAVIDQLHLPVYPNATPLQASESYSSSVMGNRHQVIVMFEASDGAEAVSSYYSSRLPKRARSFSFGPAHIFSFYEKNAQKEVTVVALQRDVTMIGLMSSWYMFGPQPSASPH